MDSEFRTKPPRSDPDKWKPLIRLVVPILMIGPLAFLEYQLAIEAWHTGSLGTWFLVVLNGGGLLLLLPILIKGIHRWANPPTTQELVRFAQESLKHELPSTAFSVRSKLTKPPHPIIYSALPATFVILSVYLAYIGRMPGFFITLFFAALFGGLMLGFFREQKQRRQQVITIDPVRRSLLFENFNFISKFLPTKPATSEEISFDQLLGTDYYPPGRGPAWLAIRTTKGTISLTDEMQEFDRVHAIVDSLVLLNKSDSDSYQEKLNAEPVVETPWYGWLILAITVSAIVLIGWKFMYSD